jgi:hypothetical protein
VLGAVAETRRLMEGKGVEELGAVAASAVRALVASKAPFMAAVPYVVLLQDVGSLEQRVDATAEALSLLSGAARSPASKVAASAEAVRVAIASRGEDASSFVKAVDMAGGVAARRAMAIGLGTVAASYAASLSDIPSLVLAILGGPLVPSSASDLVADASSVGIQAIVATQ